MGIYDRLGQVKSVAEYDAEANQAASNKLALLSQQQNFADANALRDAARSFGDDPNANYKAILGTGNVKAAQDYRAGQLTNQKTQADIALSQSHAGNFDSEVASRAIADKIKAYDFHRQQLGSLTDPSQIDAWAAQGVKDGVMGFQESAAGAQAMKAYAAQNGFEAAKAQAMRGGMSAMQQLQQQLEQTKAQETARHNVAGEGNQVAQLAETQRSHKANEGIAGAHLTLARQTQAATLTKPFEVTGPDGSPQLVQMSKDGQLQPVPGYGPKAGSAKPLTESQGKDLGFGSRMREADKIITGLTGQYSPMAVNAKITAEGLPGVGGIAGPIANMALGDSAQSAEQAQRDFVNAILRRESGAAISESEFQNARKQYFPQSGDGQQVLKQKEANRRLAIEGTMASVPEGRRGSLGPQGGGLPSLDAITAELARRGH